MRGAAVLLLLAAVSACASPPPDAYWGGSPQRVGEAVGVGRDAAGEACTQQVLGGGADIFCGSWKRPAGHVRGGGAAGQAALAGLATASPWRVGLNDRYLCGDPVATTILGDVPAEVLSCTRRVGSWPQVAMVASVGGKIYYADSILPVLPVLQRSIGVLSGRIRADAPRLPPGGADAIFAARLAAQSFSAGDVGQYEHLIQAGTRTNLAEAYAEAEQAFRAALALQRKALGASDPNVATPLTYLALQVSDLAVVLADDGTWTFLLRDQEISIVRSPVDAAGMAALVKQVRAGIEPTSAGVPRFDTEAAGRLYAETLGRVEPRLAGLSDLVVAPTGPLLSIPFAVLLTGPADPGRLGQAPWLLRRFAIAQVPAAANFVSLRRVAATSRATRPWFGLGDFRPPTLAQAERSFPGQACAQSAQLLAGLPPLPFAQRELGAARAILGGAPSDELLGTAYTAPAVRRARLNDYRVLHFASHALLPNELPCEAEPTIIASTPAGALDASGARLRASELTGLDLDADVVILSACNTGGPGGMGGESLSGLARAFFYAGARSLMVTQWSVNDQATAYLVADTLNRLRKDEGGGVAGALRLAQLGMLDAAGKAMPADLAHPFYWASFSLIGEGRERAGPPLGASAQGAAQARLAGL